MADEGLGVQVGGSAQETRLLDGRVVLFQPLDGYRAAIDPVLLAAAVPQTGWSTALDVGTGTGAALLCLLQRLTDRRCVGLEIQPTHVALAEQSVRATGCFDRACVVEGDLCGSLPEDFENRTFDHVMTNPPFHRPGRRPLHEGRAMALMEEIPLAQWLDFCLRRLRPRGGLTLIYRADRLDEILAALHGRAGAVEVIPLWPHHGVAAKRVIVRARKGLKSPLVMHPGLVLHQADGTYTPQANAVLRHACALDEVMGG